MAKVKKIRRTQGGSSFVDLEWAGDEISDLLKDNILGNLTPVMSAMEDDARNTVHVGTVRRGVYKKGKYAGKEWTSREPGRLKKSIRASVQIRKDKTAIIGFLEAGDDLAYYAGMEEMRHPYLRPAFNKNQGKAIDAINKAVEETGKV